MLDRLKNICSFIRAWRVLLERSKRSTCTTSLSKSVWKVKGNSRANNHIYRTLTDTLNRRRLAGDLSGGQKRRLSIAISLMGEPDVIFLDEPSSGLDPGNRRGLWQVIEKIRVRTGASVFFVLTRHQENRCLLLTTHSMEEAEALCTRIAIQRYYHRYLIDYSNLYITVWADWKQSVLNTNWSASTAHSTRLSSSPMKTNIKMCNGTA